MAYFKIKIYTMANKLNLKSTKDSSLLKDKSMNDLIASNPAKATLMLNYLIIILKLNEEDKSKAVQFINTYVSKLTCPFNYKEFLSQFFKNIKEVKFGMKSDDYDQIMTPQFDALIQILKDNGQDYLAQISELLTTVFKDSIGTNDKLSLSIINKLKALKSDKLDYLYGILYSKSYENIDYKKAIKCLEKAYQAGDKLAKFELGKIYANVRELKDIKKAIEIFNDSLKDNILEAYNCLANIYWKELSIKDINLSFSYIDKLLASDVEDKLKGDAYRILGYIYWKDPEYKDIEKSISCFKKSVDLGIYGSYIQLAEVHFRVPEYRDLDKYMYYCNKAIEHGDYFGYWCFGNLYWKIDKYRNLDLAIEYFNKAIEKNVRGSHLSLAGIYLSEPGYINLKKGDKLIRESIRLKLPYVYYYVGRYLLTDKDHQDLAKAEKYFILDNHHKSYREITKYYCHTLNDCKNALRLALIFAKNSDECYVDEIFEYIFNYFDIIPLDILKDTVDKLKMIDNSNSNKILGDIFKNRKLLYYNREDHINYYLRAIKQDKSNEKAYQALGYCYYYGLGVTCDYKLAYNYFKECEKYNGKCEYIMKVIDAKLSLNNTATLNTDKLNENTTTQDIIELIDKLFNNTLEGEIKTYLISALTIYVNYLKVENETGLSLDYSSCIMMLFKTLENVIKKYLIFEYRDYLKDNVDPKLLSQNTYLVYRTDEGTYEYKDHGKFEKFTLNDFKKIVGYNKYNKKIINSDIKAFNSYQNSLESNATVVTFDRPIYDYFYSIFAKNWHNKLIGDDELTNYLSLLSDYISDATEAFRNPAVHYQSMSKSDAIIILNDLLFERKILSGFFINLKGNVTETWYL